MIFIYRQINLKNVWYYKCNTFKIINTYKLYGIYVCMYIFIHVWTKKYVYGVNIRIGVLSVSQVKSNILKTNSYQGYYRITG